MMTEDDCRWHAQWRAASGHPGGWRVVREFFPPLYAEKRGLEELNRRDGRTLLFRTSKSAQRRADAMNKQD